MQKIKILVISTELPSLKGGGNVRNYNLLKNIPKNIYSVRLLSLIGADTYQSIKKLESDLGIKIVTIPTHSLSIRDQLLSTVKERTIPYMKSYKMSGLDKKILEEIEMQKPDIIQLEQLNAFYAIDNIIPLIKRNKIKLILDAHNVENIAFSESLRSSSIHKKILGKLLLSKLKSLEHISALVVDHIFVCSTVDADYFSKLVPPSKISVIANGVDCSYFTPMRHSTSKTLLFMGGMSYPPNDEALRYYFQEIHPTLVKTYPDLKIYITGNSPKPWILHLAQKDHSIIVKGLVKDVRDYLAIADICICPIKSGSGTRLKLLEYFASAKAVVSSSKGAEGIEVVDAKNILIANNSHDFINHIVDLIENDKKKRMIGDNARILAEKTYSWEKIIKNVLEVYNNVIK